MKRLISLLAILCATNSSCMNPSENNDPNRASKAIQQQELPLQEALHQKDMQLGDPIFMRIFKESNELEIWMQKGNKFELFKSYPICYFSGGLGSKKKEGDKKSPEGFYFVKPGQMNPNSRFHLAFNIGYPNAYDRAHGYTGSAIMVHGNCVSVGCYAMTDPIIEEIYTIVQKAFDNGQGLFRIHIFPFRMEDDALEQHKNSDWYPFWKNLQTGYQHFETYRVPPNVEVQNKKYIFEKIEQ